MDSYDPSNGTSSPALSNDEQSTEELYSSDDEYIEFESSSDEEDHIDYILSNYFVPSSTRTQFLATYRHQKFPFRASIMRYIAENPTSPKVYQKMVKTCKFFFLQNPILVLDHMYYDSAWLLLEKKLRFDLTNMQSKFWIRRQFTVFAKSNGKNVISSIIPKILHFDANKLRIENHVIPQTDYIYLTSSAERIYLTDFAIKDDNGFLLPFEKLIEPASNAKFFHWSSKTTLPKITSKTFEELLKLPHFLRLFYFKLDGIPEEFDLEGFYTYLKTTKRTSFELKFDASISEAYKARLDEIIKEILATKNRQYRTPVFDYPGLNSEICLEQHFENSKFVLHFEDHEL